MDDLVKQLKQIAWSYKATDNKECNEYSACTEAATAIEAQNALIWELVGALKPLFGSHGGLMGTGAGHEAALRVATALTHAKERGYE